ncbi:hypothetical protein DCC62_11315 [candidate division KSB1 bacterium]|nr:MAG: hypothetical protein DCC62_11315 [candidate division KSB1 bacterium]
MRLLPEYLESIRNGRKKSTIRIGRRVVRGNKLIFDSSNSMLQVAVKQVRYKKFSEFDEEDAHKDGFNSLVELREAVKAIYPDIKDSSRMTIIEFDLV